jgi:3-oxoacyl-[acyl-carrier protein] reductase
MTGSAAGKRVLVSGAASDAGRAVCAALAAAGATVIAVGSNAVRLEAVTAAERHVVDLTDAAAVAALHEALGAGGAGGIDAVIHLVGGWRGGRSLEDWEWLEPRILTTLRVVSAEFRDDLVASDAGRFAIVSSTGVDKPTWGNANYVALKSAGEAWVAALASGWAKAGTAAAVTYVVTSLGEGGTRVETLADAVCELWNADTATLNGARILL